MTLHVRVPSSLVVAFASIWLGCSSPDGLACPEGTWDHDSNGSTACVAWTSCEAGQFVASGGTASKDRVCAACESGTFSSEANAAACVAWTTCEAGQFVASEGSAARDQTCEACPDGTLSQSANQSACTQPDECAAGTVQVAPATNTAPAVCEACDVGTHCAGGTSPETVCADGTWDHDSEPATACVAWKDCLAGTFVTQGGSASGDRACAACEGGTFSSSANAVSCEDWTTCEPGTFVTQAGSTTRDQACAACPDGTLSQSANQSACTQPDECAAGTVQVEPATASTQPVCAACEAGTHCAGGSAPKEACADGTWDHDSNPATACIGWKDCLAGTFVSQDGSATDDRACEACEDGTFSATLNAAACSEWTECGPGTIVEAEGSSVRDRSCEACEDGSFSSSANASSCSAWSDCEPGTWVSSPASASNDRVCEACDAGSFSSSQNAEICQPWTACVPGEVLSAEGSATLDQVCTECEAGAWDDDSNPLTACVAWSDCEPGEYVSAEGNAASDRDCAACDAGHSSLEQNADTCFAVATAVESQTSTTCALLGDGRVKCWGLNFSGQLGVGDTAIRGSSAGSMGNALPAVDLGTGSVATAIAVGQGHACARLNGGAVKCWGSNSYGQLGQGDVDARGDEAGELGDALSPVDLGTGRTATAIVAGAHHTCALLNGGQVKCWGNNDLGQLGLGDRVHRGNGPGEMGDALPAVALGTGRTATAISAGSHHTCALLDDGRMKCWGSNSNGQLGLGDRLDRGDDPGEMGDALPAVSLAGGRPARSIGAGAEQSCAVLQGNSLQCWGRNALGALGLGDTLDRGDAPGEMGDALPTVDLGNGRMARVIRPSASRTCALLNNSSVKCWGSNVNGQLGLGDTNARGDGAGEMGNALPAVALGSGQTATALASGSTHSCAVLGDGRVKCWGINSAGALGLGDGVHRGALPGDMGDALPAVDLGSRL